MTSMKRRIFLKGSLATGAVGMAVSTGLLTPRMSFAAWSKAAFEAKDVNSAVSALYGAGSMTDSDKIKIKAPDIAENGAVVPVSVTTSIDGASSISIIAESWVEVTLCRTRCLICRLFSAPPVINWMGPR